LNPGGENSKLEKQVREALAKPAISSISTKPSKGSTFESAT
jgi:hypothetical protein